MKIMKIILRLIKSVYDTLVSWVIGFALAVGTVLSFYVVKNTGYVYMIITTILLIGATICKYISLTVEDEENENKNSK